jgi:transcriptional regulator with GAF, ATPase, and Fis domain/serine/threonine protein kinase/tetratricopeptide (TPR) repeat protein
MVSPLRPSLRDRYRVLKQLSVTSANHVVLAEDCRRGEALCALKFSTVENSRAFAAAHREFEILRRLHHPGLAEVFDFGRLDPSEFHSVGLGDPRPALRTERVPSSRTDGSVRGPPETGPIAYLASVYYEGLHLREAFLRLFPARSAAERHRSTPDSEDRWRVFFEALAGICEALDAVHSHGLIHYDIKPENLLLQVRDEENILAGFRARILDFGLADAETTPLGTGLRGTVPYLAPELLQHGVADRRSDLYSLGVTIAFAVSGRFPFPGTQPREWLAAVRKGSWLPPQSLCPAAPTGLHELIERLCQRNPDDRFSEATDVVGHLEEIGSFRSTGRRHLSGRTVPRTAWRSELTAIQHEIEKLTRGDTETSAILVEGDSGYFARELIEEVEALAMMEGVRVYTGNCRLPRSFVYQPFAEILAKLSIDFDLAEPRYAAFRETLATFSPYPLPSSPPRPPLPPARAETRFLNTVAEFFLELARRGPLILCFRDLHLAGREPPFTEAPKILIVGTFSQGNELREGQAEVASTRALLSDLVSSFYTTHLTLEDLGLDQIKEWLKERAPQWKPAGDFLRRLHESSAGIPRLLDEFPRRFGPEGPSDDLHDFANLPSRAEDAILLRIRKLPATEQQLLEFLATTHTAVSLKELIDLATFADETFPKALIDLVRSDTETVFGILRTLEESGFVELREGLDGSEVLIASDGAAERLYRELPDARRTTFHATFMRLLESWLVRRGSAGISEDLAFHARLSGNFPRYLRETFAVADKLADAHGLAATALVYEDVLERLAATSAAAGPADSAGGLGEFAGREAHVIDREPGTAFLVSHSTGVAPSAKRSRLIANHRLAELYFELGKVQRAFEKLTMLSSLLEGTTQHVERAIVYRRMGEACQKRGKLGNAGHFLETSLTLLRALPESAPSTNTAGVVPKLEIACTLLALAKYRLLRDEIENAESVLRECVQLLEELPQSNRHLGLAYRLQAEIDRRAGNHSQAIELNLATLELAQGENDLSLVGETLGVLGSNHVTAGEYDKATSYFDQRLEVATTLNCKSELAAAHNSLGRVGYNRGDHQSALEHYSQCLTLRKETGDLRGIANSYNNLGLVYQVKDELGRATDCFKRSIDLFSRTGDQHGIAAGMNNLASTLELSGKYNEAIEYSFRALDKRKKLGSQTGIAFCYYHIAKTYQSRGEFEKAASYASKGLHLRKELGERLGIAYSRLQLSELRLAQGRLAESLVMLDEGIDDFQRLDNEVGSLVARETLARVFFGLGDVDRAKSLSQKVLERAIQLKQRRLQGSCLLQLARLECHDRRFDEAERLLQDADRIFRVHNSRRQLAVALLERARLTLERGVTERAQSALEQAYSILEELGIRDLVPLYFLLRGQLELASTDADRESARKFFERGLVETHELDLRNERWRLHYRLALVEEQEGDSKLARIHFEEARSLLEDSRAHAPEAHQEHFYQLRERSEFLRHVLRPPGNPPTENAPGSAESTQHLPPPDQEKETSSRDGKIDDPASNSSLTLTHAALRLHEIAAALGSEPDLQKLLDSVMDAVLDLIDAERGFLILKGGEGDRTFVVARNLDRELVVNPEDKVSNSFAARVIRSGTSLVSGNALDDETYSASASIQNLRLRSIVCVPLRFRGTTLGAIYLDHRHRRDAFPATSVQLLQTFADQAAVAVANTRLIEENRRRNAELVQANRQKEILNQKLRYKVQQRTAQLAVVQEDLRKRQSQLEERYRLENIVGKAPAMKKVFDFVERLSQTTLSVLIHGESGTGKELLARALHFTSERKAAEFVSESCGALSESLLESELFGHVLGAFTGAVRDQKGLFELADGGTLFLDNVGSMPIEMQGKLLRVLQEGEVRRVGGQESIPIDVRIVCASSKKIEQLVEEGKFRADLYYRLNSATIAVPSLRDRGEDIPLLVEHFLQEEAAKIRDTPRIFLPEAMRMLLIQHWPGNVRELRNVIEKTLLMTAKRMIGPDDLLLEGNLTPDSTDTRGGSHPGDILASSDVHSPLTLADLDWEVSSLKEAREALDREFLRRKLARSGHRVSATAKDCEVSRETLYRLLRKHGLDRES